MVTVQTGRQLHNKDSVCWRRIKNVLIHFWLSPQTLLRAVVVIISQFPPHTVHIRSHQSLSLRDQLAIR